LAPEPIEWFGEKEKSLTMPGIYNPKNSKEK
jgi:hypothetical protein